MKSQRNAVSLVEVLVVAAVVAAGVAVMVPQILQSRSAVRKAGCARKLQQIALANLDYESTNGKFPPGRRLPDWAANGVVKTSYTSYSSVPIGNPNVETGFQSVYIWLLPQLGMQKAFDELRFDPFSKKLTIGGGAIPINPNFDAFISVGDFFVCPDDPNTTPGGLTENNYRYNFGGATPHGGARDTSNQDDNDAIDADGNLVRGNGAFTIGRGLRVSAFRRGLSKVAFFSERSKGSGIDTSQTEPSLAEILSGNGAAADFPISADELLDRCTNTEPEISPFHFSGAGRWLPGSDWSNGWPFAGYDCTEYNHVAVPNWNHTDCGATSSIPDTPGERAILCARSEHGGTVNVAFGDAHIEAFSNDIDLQIWRSLGNRKPARYLQKGGK